MRLRSLIFLGCIIGFVDSRLILVNTIQFVIDFDLGEVISLPISVIIDSIVLVPSCLSTGNYLIFNYAN